MLGRSLPRWNVARSIELDLFLNEPNIEPVIRLAVPARAALEQHLRPMIMSQLEFREPHPFAERKKHAPFCRAGFPTDMPVLAIPKPLGLLRRPQRAFVSRVRDPLDEVEDEYEYEYEYE